MSRVLVVRTDSAGDVLLAGPAVRAVARHAEVSMLVSPAGEHAARLLPGVHEAIVWPCPWSGYQPPPVDAPGTLALVSALTRRRFDTAIILTSFHQSPLPTALLLRLAGIPRICATSEDYPGSLLDLRHRLDPRDGRHEVERALALVEAAGFTATDAPARPAPPGPRYPRYPRYPRSLRYGSGRGYGPAEPHTRLAVRRPLPRPAGIPLPDRPFVVVHPGASVPARAPEPGHAARMVAALADAGWPVLVTGGPQERAVTAQVAAAVKDAPVKGTAVKGPATKGTAVKGPATKGTADGRRRSRPEPPDRQVIDLGGRTTLAELGWVLEAAACVVTGNTGPAHLAAAVGTPVVSLFAPVVPAAQWRPWGVPTIVLGDQQAPCRDSRARQCPVRDHPCLSGIPVEAVVDAVATLTAALPASAPAPASAPGATTLAEPA